MSEPFEVTVARRQTKLDKQVSALSTIETGFTMGDVIGTLQMFPELRGLWPYSSVDESGNLRDISGEGRTLTNNGTTLRSLLNNIVPYATLNGSTQYFSRADEAGLRITGSLSLGGWYYFTSLAKSMTAMSKWTAAGNQRSYLLQALSTGAVSSSVSTNGTAVFTSSGTAGEIVTGGWYFMASRFTPSTELATFVNKTKHVNTTSVPASIFVSTAGLLLGGVSAAAALNGRSAMSFLCAGLVPDSLLARFFEVSRGFFGV